MNKITEVSDSLPNIISTQEQELSDNFVELKKLLTEYENAIFSSLSSTQEYHGSIETKLGFIKDVISPYTILKQGYEFQKEINEQIAEIKKANKKYGYFRSQDNSAIQEILFEWGYQYEIKMDSRMKQFDNKREGDAYKTIRDELQNFIDEYEKIGVNLEFYQTGTPGNFITIHCYLSEQFLQSK